MAKAKTKARAKGKARPARIKEKATTPMRWSQEKTGMSSNNRICERQLHKQWQQDLWEFCSLGSSYNVPRRLPTGAMRKG